jgi:hypothetical protein
VSATLRRLRRRSRLAGAPLFRGTFASIALASAQLERWAATARAQAMRLGELVAVIDNRDQAHVTCTLATRGWARAVIGAVPEVREVLEHDDEPGELRVLMHDREHWGSMVLSELAASIALLSARESEADLVG